MLNIGKLAGVDSVDYYLSQVASGVEDYYLGNGEAPGQWTGVAAGQLGLQGRVDADALQRVLGGHDAAGRPLEGLRSSRKIPGFDLAFRAPKSVSLLWALGGSDVASEVRDAHDAAVTAALAYLEEHAGWSRRGAGGRHAVKGRGFVAAAFRHRASRDRDPLLHSHVLVANAVQADDGRWGTLDATRLYRHAKTAGYLYQTQLRHELTRRLGVAWDPVVNGTADLTGVPEPVIRAFSQRRQAIEQRLTERGESSRAAAEMAALATRKPKSDVNAVTLAAEWVTRAAALGFTPDQLTSLLGRTQLAELRPASRRHLVDELLSPDGLTAQSPTFNRRDVIQALCERLAGHDVDAAGVQALADHLTDPVCSPFIPLDVATEAGGAAGDGGQAASGSDSALGHAGELLDEQARTAYRRRLAEIDADIDQAQAIGDTQRAAQAATERDFLMRELSRAFGLGARTRRAGSASERARAAVTRALRTAMARIDTHHPALGAHLDRAVHTGTYCSYQPDPRIPTTWQL